MNRAILATTLAPDYEIIEVSDGKEAVTALQTYHGEISVLLLDIVMPGLDGFGVLEEMNRRNWIKEVPTIIISAESSSAFIDRAFSLGATDYINRPFVPSIVRRRIVSTILLHAKKQQLLDIVSGQLYLREKSSEALVSILDYAVEYRSGEGGTHMAGVGRLTKLLLLRLLSKTTRYALTASDVDIICMASGLHDIGKLMVPEDLLRKPGRLTPEEFAVIKRHARYGAQIITQLPVHKDEKLVKYAIEICRWHHERWNGEGYPDGLKGDSIPIAAQVVSLADAYDALTSKRSYKEAFSHETAIAMLHNGDCGSFNPLLLSCLDELSDTLRMETAQRSTGPSPLALHQVVDELYRGRDMNAARMTQQLEEANAKLDFFRKLSQESWFEYTKQPASLHLSSAAVSLTGLPAMMVDPLENQDFLAIIGTDTVEQIQKKLELLTPDDPYGEIPVKLLLNGKLCQCQLAVLVIWSAADSQQYTSFYGKLVNVDAPYRRLKQYAHR